MLVCGWLHASSASANEVFVQIDRSDHRACFESEQFRRGHIGREGANVTVMDSCLSDMAQLRYVNKQAGIVTRRAAALLGRLNNSRRLDANQAAQCAARALHLEAIEVTEASRTFFTDQLRDLDTRISRYDSHLRQQIPEYASALRQAREHFACSGANCPALPAIWETRVLWALTGCTHESCELVPSNREASLRLATRSQNALKNTEAETRRILAWFRELRENLSARNASYAVRIEESRQAIALIGTRFTCTDR